MLEARTVQPLDEQPPNPSKAAAYAPPPAQPTNRQPPTQAEQLERLEAQVSAVEPAKSPGSRRTIEPLSSGTTGIKRVSTDGHFGVENEPKKALPKTDAERAERYTEIFGREDSA